mgnify:CR=1 FL=1
MKITAKEAYTRLMKYAYKCASRIPLSMLEHDNFAEKMDDLLVPVLEYLRAPTYHEVVKAWDELGFKPDFDNNCLYVLSTGRKYYGVNVGVEFNSKDVRWLNALSLHYRYLQGKEKENAIKQTK